MVLTRLRHIPLSQLKKSRLLVSATRQSSSLSDRRPKDSRVRKKGQKTVKSVADLPSVYVNENGVVAAPLPKWDPTYIVPPPPGGDEGESKSKRKSRKKKEDKSNEQSATKIIDSANKAPKPVTFLAREILSNLRRFPHCLLLTRVGNFYESYFDQAVEIAHLLNIKLTSRKWNGERVAMCGFPIPHLDKYLKILVQQERRFVAMCEEFARYDSNGLKEFERRISRIVTPGTLIDESFVDPYNNNYLLAVHVPLTSLPSDSIGLAWIDVSTGEFFSKGCAFETLKDELARLGPREIVLDEFMKQHTEHPIFAALREADRLVSYCSSTIPPSGDTPITPGFPQVQGTFNRTMIPDENSDAELDSRSQTLESHLTAELSREMDYMPNQETSAIQLLTRFLQANLLEHMPLLNAPHHEDIRDRMQIDAHTIQGLEIREVGHEGSTKGSLLSVVKRTLTSGGTRLLSRWLCSPSTSMAEINGRQSLVSFFHRRQHFRTDMCEILKEMDDVSRLCQRFLLGRADFNDLIAIKSAIGTWEIVKQSCQNERLLEAAENRLALYSREWASVGSLLQRMDDLTDLHNKISEAIIVNCDSTELSLGEESNVVEEVDPKDQIPSAGKKWSINPSISKKLSKVHAMLGNLASQKEELEANLQNKYDSPSLTLRSSNQLGMFVHLSRAKRDKKKLDQDPMFYCVGESLSTKSYFYRDWTQLGNKITEATIALNAAEKEVFDMLRLEVIEHSDQLQQNAHIIDELDVFISFAILAEEMNFVRPEIVEDASYTVVNGRHPAVEMGLLSAGRQFTPNSVEMTPSSNLHVITGPNMAGKSTFLRQTALIAILAQVGSFVPADYARIGIVDKLFSRIGAKDDLYRDRSTFMVEMLETAEILCRATDRSLIIMDEVGRGTTVRDGLAIAFASLHHIATVTKSRCLFATHFHELAEMLGNTNNERGTGVFPNVRFYCSDVDDIEDCHFAYSYRLQPGINRDSHGLKVAHLAGVPSSAMEVAIDTLSWLRMRGTDNIQSNYKEFLQSTLKSTS